MKNVDSRKQPVTLIKWLQYRLSKFTTKLENSQETFLLQGFFVKLEILNCRPITLEKRDRFANGFFFLKIQKF